jgi:hypothetical protein
LRFTSSDQATDEYEAPKVRPSAPRRFHDVFVDVADTDENRTFFVAFKNQLKTRFRHLDLRMTTFLIEVI